MQKQEVVVCQHFLNKGSCKFGSSCRHSHSSTLVKAVPKLHPHLVGPDPESKRKKFFCNECGKKRSEGGYRCVSGCDYDLCPSCMDSNAEAIDTAALIASVTGGGSRTSSCISSSISSSSGGSDGGDASTA